MGFETLLQTLVCCLLHHLGKGLRDLVLGVINVVKLVEEQILERRNVLCKDTHDNLL